MTTTLDDPRTAAGYRAHTHARSTGTLVLLVDGVEGGYDTDGGRWQTICEPHGGIISHETRAIAATWMRHPEEWCSECQEAKS